MEKADPNELSRRLLAARLLFDNAGSSPERRREAVRLSLVAAQEIISRALGAELAWPLLELNAALADLDSGRVDVLLKPTMTGRRAASTFDESDHVLAAALVDQIAEAKGQSIEATTVQIARRLGVAAESLTSWRKKARTARYGEQFRESYQTWRMALRSADPVAIEGLTEDLVARLRR